MGVALGALLCIAFVCAIIGDFILFTWIIDAWREDKIFINLKQSVPLSMKCFHYYPLYRNNGLWYFWNETWSDLIGPYKTQGEASVALKSYCKTLNPDE